MPDTPVKNLFDEIPADLPEELIETLVESEYLRLERIVSRAHSSPDNFWYEQQQNEWVMVVQGSARLQFADKQQELELNAGDHLVIQAGERHRVNWTSQEPECIWLCLFYPA